MDNFGGGYIGPSVNVVMIHGIYILVIQLKCAQFRHASPMSYVGYCEILFNCV